MRDDTNYLQLLYNRVCADLWFITINEFIMKNKPKMNSMELAEHIKKNLDKYLSLEEQKGLICSQICVVENDTLNSTILGFSAELVAAQTATALQVKLDDKNNSDYNPYNPDEEPLLFLLWKFCDEELDGDFEFVLVDYSMN